MNTATIATLHQPIEGTAQLGADGTLTVGRYADSSPAHWQLVAGGDARHALIVGAAGAGMSCLLHSILDGAAAAGASTQLIDLSTGLLADSTHPTVIGVRDTRTVLSMTVDVARARLAASVDAGPQKLLVLAVDALHELAADQRCAEQLADLMPIAAKARIAVIATTVDATLPATGGAHTRALLAQHTVVLLRTRQRTTPSLLGLDAPDLFAGSDAPGVGYLPRQRPGMPFRAYWRP